jgi:polyphenol oxidase
MAYISGNVVCFDSFEKFKDEICVAFTTRNGGASEIPYDSLNMGLNTDDDMDSVMNNIKHTLNSLGLGSKRAFATNQVHGDRIEVIRGRVDHQDSLTILAETDGVVTDSRDIAVVTFYADCTSIMAYDPQNGVIGVAHSGWKGTAKRIGEKLISTMAGEFGSDPRDIICAIGPTSESCCYEVDKSVKDEIESSGLDFSAHSIEKGNDKYMLSMSSLNKEVLIKAGVADQNIEVSGQCTICNPDTFFSYRRDGKSAGRMSAIVALR